MPVVFIAGHTTAEAETRARAAGAIDLIHKPGVPEVVRGWVRAHLAPKQKTDSWRRL